MTSFARLLVIGSSRSPSPPPRPPSAAAPQTDATGDGDDLTEDELRKGGCGAVGLWRDAPAPRQPRGDGLPDRAHRARERLFAGGLVDTAAVLRGHARGRCAHEGHRRLSDRHRVRGQLAACFVLHRPRVALGPDERPLDLGPLPVHPLQQGYRVPRPDHGAGRAVEAAARSRVAWFGCRGSTSSSSPASSVST